MGCELSFIPEFDRYPAVFTRWEGAECQGYQACLYGHKLKHVRISGPGRINGNGQAWWDEFKRRNKEGISSPQNDTERMMLAANSANPNLADAGSGGGGRQTNFLRPPNLQLIGCEDVHLADFSSVDSPFWNTHLVYCDNVTVSGIHIENAKGGPNTDGLSIDSPDGAHQQLPHRGG